MFKTILTSFINPEHELCLLAKEMDWIGLEKEFAPLNGTVGRPSVPSQNDCRIASAEADVQPG